MDTMTTVYGYRGNILYCGETRNGLKHGQGCEYYNGEPGYEALLYKGQFKNGIREGSGEEYYESGELLYRGSWSLGAKHGTGSLYSRSGYIIFGEHFFNDRPIEKVREVTLKDEKIDRIPLLPYDGYTIVYRKDGVKYYVGEVKQGLFWGRGEQSYQFGNGNLYYDGGWTAGTKNGRGRLYYNSGALDYCGTFSNNKKYGWGASYYESGALIYEGTYMGNHPYGEGVSYHENGRIKFEGFFEDYMISRGKEYYKNGILRYKGYYNHGSRNYYGPRYFTEGKLYYETGELWFEGSFEIERSGNYRYPLFKGAKSFSKGREFDKNGNVIRVV